MNQQPNIYKGYQKLIVDETTHALTIPAGAVAAVVVVESADPAQTNSAVVCRFLEHGEEVLAGDDGLPLAVSGFYSVEGPVNLKNFRIKGAEAGKSHVVKVVYYGE